jgi:putative membrane protein
MELRARERVPELTAVLSVASLAAVFAAVGGVVPASLLPAAPDSLLDAIPHVNAVLSTAALVTIALGVRYIRRDDVRRHRAMMLTTLSLFVAFLVLYLYRISLEGTAAFPGPDAVYQFVYLPTLAIHVFLAIVCIPLLYYVLLLALTRPVAELYETPHRRVGRVAAALWFVSFALGDVVYLLLYVVY